eukprot:4169671-Lingulodinium_polyedra.AAC.1
MAGGSSSKAAVKGVVDQAWQVVVVVIMQVVAGQFQGRPRSEEAVAQVAFRKGCWRREQG